MHKSQMIALAQALFATGRYRSYKDARDEAIALCLGTVPAGGFKLQAVLVRQPDGSLVPSPFTVK